MGGIKKNTGKYLSVEEYSVKTNNYIWDMPCRTNANYEVWIETIFNCPKST